MSRFTLKGVVIRCSSDKTSVVRVERIVSHPLYQKKMRRFKSYLCHDHENRCKEGDVVMIRESRPFSKRKKFEVIYGESSLEGGEI